LPPEPPELPVLAEPERAPPLRPRPAPELDEADLRPPLPREDLALPDDFLPPVDFLPPADFPPPVPELPLDEDAADERLDPALDDFPRVEVDLRPPVEPVLLLRAPLLFAVLLPARDPALLPDDDAREVPELEREALLRPLDDFAPPLRDDDLDDPLLEPDEPSSAVHLPDSTRCAASATASAMIEPSFVALDIMLVAALEAVSAASRPASRILRRAAGLALIAAAAAARPAASISLLIAALVILSTVSFELPEDFEEFFRVDLAMAVLPPLFGKRHMTAVTVP
jgi:hypothetical protein